MIERRHTTVLLQHLFSSVVLCCFVAAVEVDVIHFFLLCVM